MYQSNNNNQRTGARTLSLPSCSRILVLVFMCLITCVGTMAQSVSFSGSDKTLVITASGDLTNYKFVDTSYQVFTHDGGANISPNNWEIGRAHV